jgi:sulfur-oxidizing protein SoxY
VTHAFGRRQVLRGAVAAVGGGALLRVRPAHGQTPRDLAAAIRGFTGGAVPSTGRVALEVAQLVDNGNAVPVAVRVESPMTAAEHVRRIGLFNEKNPQPDVAVFALGPRSGRAFVATRIRLATSQRLVAVAETSDGAFWQHAVDVVVVLAACIE